MAIPTGILIGQFVNAQTTTSQKVEEVQEQVQSNGAQLDATTLGTAGAVGVGGLALIREMMSTRKLKTADKETDRDIGMSYLYIYRLIQTMDAYIPAVSKCLDAPFSSDPMAKDITIRRKMAEDAGGWAAYLNTQLNVQTPSMTPSAGVLIADAQNTQTQATGQNTEVKTITPPSPPVNNTANTQQQTSQNTSTTPTK